MPNRTKWRFVAFAFEQAVRARVYVTGDRRSIGGAAQISAGTKQGVVFDFGRRARPASGDTHRDQESAGGSVSTPQKKYFKTNWTMR
jgi:hypothetical protein